MMIGRCFAWMVVALAAACVPGNREPAPDMPAPHSAPPAAATRQESGATHHAHVRGTVVGRDGQPLGGVQLLADRLPAATADMPRARAVTRTDGTFALPLRATLHADSARVEVKVVAFGFIYATGGALPADSVVVPVTMVPATRQPNVYTTRLTLPVSRR
ncbi:MAG TPA: hypothetical protein VHG93_06600 [Longimicrobium sp.]|nr:hypothetical protein [Longimicrobium sp.]